MGETGKMSSTPRPDEIKNELKRSGSDSLSWNKVQELDRLPRGIGTSKAGVPKHRRLTEVGRMLIHLYVQPSSRSYVLQS